MKPTLLSLVLLAVTTVMAGEPFFKDPFTEGGAVPERRALRGDWKIAGGVARCTQDDELYKKNKDHGPVIFYEVPTTDATFRFSMKPTGCQSIVFTLNGSEGHVFRFVTSSRGTGFRAFPPGEEKSIQTALHPEWKAPDGEWTQVSVTMKGDTATVGFGGHEPITIPHASYTATKVNFSIGFAFGTFEVKDVAVSK